MCIKSDKTTLLGNVIITISLVLLVIYFYFTLRMKYPIVFTILVIVLSYMLIAQWFCTERTIILDNEGCTVSFLFLHRRFSWDEIQYRRYVDMKYATGSKPINDKGVEFSTRPINRPKRLMCYDFSLLFCPFSFHYFFVYFPPVLSNRKSNDLLPNYYTVEESEFRNNMEQWDIHLTES